MAGVNIFVALFFCVAIVLTILCFMNKNSIKENMRLRAYSFGFPTHRGRRGSWGRGRRWRRRPWWRRGYVPLYAGPYAYPMIYRDWTYPNIQPYLTGACYDSNKDDDCAIGYSKVRRDSDGSGKIDKKDDWLCCRNNRIF